MAVSIPWKVRVRKRLKDLATKLMENYTFWEVGFFCACIYVVATFFGAKHGIHTALFSIAFYFIVMEVFEHLKDIATKLSKKY